MNRGQRLRLPRSNFDQRPLLEPHIFRREMAEPEGRTKLRLEIAHVLFIDIVGYSKLLI